MAYETGSQPEVRPELRQERRPRAVMWVVVLIWVQVVANVLLGLLVLGLAQEDESHGRDVPGLVYFIGYVSFLAAALLAVCAVLLVGRRLGWPRYTVITIEWLLVASWFVMLFAAGTGGGAGIPPIIPMVVALQLARKEMTDWYDDSPHRR
ncbi:hypothetical protein [Streptomyces sp. B6B3]|uniref:hypothetical protein n=1 Tax=Streptomyces sp. B6B3 TaxID=3153570 RepID=UPI00325F0634